MRLAVGKRKSLLAAICLLSVASVFILFPKVSQQAKPAVVKTRIRERAPVEREFTLPTERVRKKSRWVPVVSLQQPGDETMFAKSSKEAEAIFGGCERARARLLTQSESATSSSFVFGVEAPSAGEVGTVKAQIADIQSAVDPGARMEFDAWLDKAVKNYDPYGEKGRRMLWISVSNDPKMSVTLIANQMDTFDNVDKMFGPGKFKIDRITQMTTWNDAKAIPERLRPYLQTDAE